MNNTNVPQKVIEKFRDAQNILITVNANPTVDQLSAALGMALVCNKLGKHVAAIFSGNVPSAIEFLKPEATFENSVDSLRDFIIALDKDKADHLRYKLVGDYVKIFITPYKTSLSQDDLEFSLGDYNVDYVFAVGVASMEDLDAALADHGKIVHDATVVAMEVSKDGTSLDAIEWSDKKAESYCELVAAFAEKMKDKKSLIDEQTATALMTGIVATTERFRNELTTPQNMNLAARLMSAGANQQLIATNLDKDEQVAVQPPEPQPQPQPTPVVEADQKAKPQQKRPVNKQPAPQKQNPSKPAKKKRNDGDFKIAHEYKGDVDEVDRQVKEDLHTEARLKAEEELERLTHTEKVAPSDQALIEELDQVTHKKQPQQNADQMTTIPHNQEPNEPSIGGTLNATTEQAAADKRRESESDRNKTILHHGTAAGAGYVSSSDQPTFNAPINATAEAAQKNSMAGTDDLFDVTAPVKSQSEEDMRNMTLEQIDSAHRGASDARTAVQDAFSTNAPQQMTPEPVFPVSQPSMAGMTPQAEPQLMQPVHEHQPDVGAPLPPFDGMPPMPDMSTLPQIPTQPAMTPQMQTTQPGEPIPGLPPLPQMPQLPSAQPVAPTGAPQPQPAPQDPTQFRIPGQ